MGSGKLVLGYGITNVYHAEPEVFLNNIATSFKVNVKGILYGDDEEVNELFIDHSFGKTLTVNVSLFLGEDSSYDVIYPIDIGYEKDLMFSFLPNNVFSVMHIPFAETWRFLIAAILGDYDRYLKGHDNYIKTQLELRSLYWPLLAGLNCKQIFMTTNAHHNWENVILYREEYDCMFEFEDILQAAKDADGIQLFDLLEAFGGKFDDQLKAIYDDDVFKIGFIDKLS